MAAKLHPFLKEFALRGFKLQIRPSETVKDSLKVNQMTLK